MLHIVEGDLLKSDCDYIGHQVNCQGVMASGIAKQIREQLPGAYKIFQADLRTPTAKLGGYALANTNVEPFKGVFNLYGQLTYGKDEATYTSYMSLHSAIKKMLSMIVGKHSEGTQKIGLPYKIGCGLAGGSWVIVLNILENLSSEFNQDIYLYKLEESK